MTLDRNETRKSLPVHSIPREPSTLLCTCPGTCQFRSCDAFWTGTTTVCQWCWSQEARRRDPGVDASGCLTTWKPREPWVLLTSAAHRTGMARRCCCWYGTINRMVVSIALPRGSGGGVGCQASCPRVGRVASSCGHPHRLGRALLGPPRHQGDQVASDVVVDIRQFGRAKLAFRRRVWSYRRLNATVELIP